MSTIGAVYVLIVLFTTGSANGGIGIVKHEFNNLERCEFARGEIIKANDFSGVKLVSQGCYRV